MSCCSLTFIQPLYWNVFVNRLMMSSSSLVFARPIILTVAKCWDPSPQGYFTLPRSESPLCSQLSFSITESPLTCNVGVCADEPIRPIDPAAWVSHSVAMTGAYPPYPGSSSLSTITSSSSVTETERESLSSTSVSHSQLFHIHTILSVHYIHS